MTVYSDIIVESGYKIDRGRVRRTVNNLLVSRGLSSNIELAVKVVGERKIRDLNHKYLDVDEVTDVLSFPLEEAVSPDGILRLGDVVVCYPMAVAAAREKDIMVDQEVDGLVEHGLKHLLGEHHE
jgi:probable rRNA maturation factor